MVRFLERNGYDVSYIAGVDTDRHGAAAQEPQGVPVGRARRVLVGGAAGQRRGRARRRGEPRVLHAATRCTGTRATRTPSPARATPYRTLVSYKETWSNAKIDPTPEWTGTWRDPRFASPANGAGHARERAHRDACTCRTTPTCRSRSRRTKASCGSGATPSLASLATGTTAALAAAHGRLRVRRGPRQRLRARRAWSACRRRPAPSPQYLQDFGNTVAAGHDDAPPHPVQGAERRARLLGRARSSGRWGLDQTHDGDGAAADSRMQQATVNLLADMGAQPGTLMSGLVAATASTDTTAPDRRRSPRPRRAPRSRTAPPSPSPARRPTSAARVAGVEVSTDGGATWHPATGTTTWTYTYVQRAAARSRSRSRAIDDSANIGDAGARRSVTVSLPVHRLRHDRARGRRAADDRARSSSACGSRRRPTATSPASGSTRAPATRARTPGSLWSATGASSARSPSRTRPRRAGRRRSSSRRSR